MNGCRDISREIFTIVALFSGGRSWALTNETQATLLGSRILPPLPAAELFSIDVPRLTTPLPAPWKQPPLLAASFPLQTTSLNVIVPSASHPTTWRSEKGTGSGSGFGISHDILSAIPIVHPWLSTKSPVCRDCYYFRNKLCYAATDHSTDIFHRKIRSVRTLTGLVQDNLPCLRPRRYMRKYARHQHKQTKCPHKTKASANVRTGTAVLTYYE